VCEFGGARLRLNFLDDDEADEKSKDRVLTGSLSSIEWYMMHVFATSLAGVVVEGIAGLG
jgi:hypothetical protein